jgi:uncharacterized protein YdiU (UPF0061 family)
MLVYNECGDKMNQHTYKKMSNKFYKEANPSLKKDKLVYLNEGLLGMLNLKDIEEVFNIEPFSQAYSGHQFGHYTVLGDGRAIMIGEKSGFDIQLKGSGPTVFSRRGDGFATLESVIKETIISEAMHHLGVSTTRTLGVYKSEETMMRDTVHPKGALLRVSPSHIRVGTFEYVAQYGNDEDLFNLINYLKEKHNLKLGTESLTEDFLKHMIKEQAILIAKWMSIGFVHGVMNTDNVSCSNVTIDYGPCAFMDEYNPNVVFSSIDHQGRYKYSNQPYIGSWNMAVLAEVLLPVLSDIKEEAIKKANEILSEFENIYHEEYYLLFLAKIGVSEDNKVNRSLVDQLLNLMQIHKLDFTNTFYQLTARKELPKELSGWFSNYQQLIKQPDYQLMKQFNPVIIPRNHLVKEAALKASLENNETLFYELMKLYKNPYDYEAEIDDIYKQPNITGNRFITTCGT